MRVCDCTCIVELRRRRGKMDRLGFKLFSPDVSAAEAVRVCEHVNLDAISSVFIFVQRIVENVEQSEALGK